MQRFGDSLRRVVRSRYGISRLSQQHTTPLSTLASDASADNFDDQVLVEGNGSFRTAVLNRPSALNALTAAMGARLQKLYKSWEDNPDIGFVMMKWQGILCWWRYRTYLKPHVALLNGITMGGGAGVSIPGTFRVATNKTVFATPETLIGFHPDAGASFYLSRLPGHIGEYLGLTGEKLVGSEMLACGLATHFTSIERLSILEEQLGKLVTDDYSVIENCLENNAELVYPDKTSIIQRIEMLDKCFCLDSVEEIINAVESEARRTNDELWNSTLRRLKEASPLSLKVSLRSIREGRFQTFDQCLDREYRMSLQGVSGQISRDFCEGVRARVVNKDYLPRWNPPTLEHVSEDMVDQYFSPMSESEPGLDLPTKLREAFP